MSVRMLSVSFILLYSSLFLTSNAQTYSTDSLAVVQILAANGLDSLPVESVTGMTNGRISSLYVDRINLQILPECLGDLGELTNLMISGNSLTELPASIGKLTKLQHISASDNFLPALPPSFSQLQNLQDIYLIRNRLTSWPEVFNTMPGITMIDVGGNNLTKLPEQIASYPALQRLYINDNYLTELPEPFAALELEVVHVAGNALCGVSEALTTWLDKYDYYKVDSKWKTYQSCDRFFMDSLKVRAFLDTNGWNTIAVDSVVDVVNGQIAGIDVSAGRRAALQPLQKKRAGAETVMAIPTRMEEMKHLRSLNLSGNRMDSIPAHLAHLCHLASLNLSGTNLSTMPIFMLAFKNLTMLDISQNLLAGLPVELAAWADTYAPNWENKQLVTAVAHEKGFLRPSQIQCKVRQVNKQTVKLEVTFSEPSTATITLCSLSGRAVTKGVQQHFYTGTHCLAIGASSLARGIYIVHVQSATNGSLVRQFMVN